MPRCPASQPLAGPVHEESRSTYDAAIARFELDPTNPALGSQFEIEDDPLDALFLLRLDDPRLERSDQAGLAELPSVEVRTRLRGLGRLIGISDVEEDFPRVSWTEPLPPMR